MIARWGIVIAASVVACNYDEHMRTAKADRIEPALVGHYGGGGGSEYRSLQLNADGSAEVDQQIVCNKAPCPTLLQGTWRATELKRNHGAVEITLGGDIKRLQVIPEDDKPAIKGYRR